MYGDRAGPVLGSLLYTLSVLYGLCVRLRVFLYSRGVLKTERLPSRVISVGNITVGGSGKTPVTIFLASELKKAGVRVAILSRGYGRAGSTPRVVSDGEGVLMGLGPREAGDEPLLMAQRLKGVPVIVGRDRASAGRLALREFSSEVLVLDDGFQHLRLFRDFDIVLVDSTRGLGNSHLLPRGILREPVGALSRADLIMVKGAGGAGNPDIGDILGMDKVKGVSSIPLKGFSYTPSRLYDVFSGETARSSTLRGTGVAALAGIAEPGSFVETLEGLGAGVSKTLFYPDHHDYTPADVDDIVNEARLTHSRTVVTTEKDSVKLAPFASRFEGVTLLALSVDVATFDLAGFIKERLGGLGE
jgi:tetraacyldisaccharide 4'-kinase